MDGPVRHLVFGRIGPSFVFALLGWLNLRRLVAAVAALGPNASLWAIVTGPVSLGLYCAFLCIPVVVYVSRPMPAKRDGRLAVRLLAFTGTTMLLIFGAFSDGGRVLFDMPNRAHQVAAVALIVAEAFALWGLLSLRASFSLVPEVRRLVVSGPYRLVRHPVYLAEIAIASSLLFVGDPAAWSMLVLVLFVIAQYGRALVEERLLREALPEYEAYARRTPRLVPFGPLRSG